MRADREKRAMILTAEGSRESSIKQAEGQKQAQILTAEGAKQAAILAAEAERQSRILRAQGERAAQYLQAQGQAKAIEKMFAAIKAGKPTPELLAYQYLQTLPQMAQGDANKVWMVPSDFGAALQGFAKMLGAPGDDGVFRYTPVAGRRRPAEAGGRLRRGGRAGSTRRPIRRSRRPSPAAVAEARTPVAGWPRSAAAVRAAVTAGAAADDGLRTAAAAAARRTRPVSALTAKRTYAVLAAVQAGDAMACAVPIRTDQEGPRRRRARRGTSPDDPGGQGAPRPSVCFRCTGFRGWPG